jgi:hypothetical protein
VLSQRLPLPPDIKLTRNLRQQHALSIAIFSNYLILDTILCAIPRFLVLGLLQQLSSSICTPSSSPYATKYSSSQVFTFSSSTLVLPEDDYAAPYGLESQLGQLTEGWTQEGCYRIVWLAQLTLAAGVVAATLLQFVGALCVREYAKCLWMKELREEGRLVLEENGVVVIMDGEREDQVSDLREKFLLELDVDDN